MKSSIFASGINSITTKNHLLKEFLLPKTCVSCGHIESDLCKQCENNLTILELQRCISCDRFTLNGKTHKYCFNNGFPDAVLSSFEYSGIARKIILKSKSGQNSYMLLNTLLKISYNRFILSELLKLYEFDGIIPIPSSSNFISTKRIVNHSLIIAQFIQKYYKLYFNKRIPIINILKKKNKTNQKDLNRFERYDKSNKNYYIKGQLHALENKNKILLVDDIATTGATLISASKYLKKRFKIQKIYCYTICKDLRYNYSNNV